MGTSYPLCDILLAVLQHIWCGRRCYKTLQGFAEQYLGIHEYLYNRVILKSLPPEYYLGAAHMRLLLPQPHA